MKTGYGIGLPIILLVIVLLGTDSGQAQEKLERVNLAIPVTALSQLPSYAGVRFGLFREEGLDVQIVLMNGRLVGPALLQGDLDYSTLADTMMRAATTGLPVKVIAFGGIRPALALNVRPEIKTGADLKGKNIAVTSIGSTTDFVAREIVRSFGVSDREIVTQGLGSQANNQAALRTGAVAAALFTPPYDVIMEKEGFRVIAWAGDVVKDQLQAGLVTSDNKIARNPGQVKRMVRGFVKSLVFLRKEKNRVVEMIAKQWKIEPDIAEKSYQVMLKTFSANGAASDSAIENVIQQTLKANKSQKQVSHEQVANLSFLAESRRELGLR
jgi:NitT/TauT family transport system substrate-binding protein